MNALDTAMAYQCAMIFAVEMAEDDDDKDGSWIRRAKRCEALRNALLELDLHLDSPRVGKV